MDGDRNELWMGFITVASEEDRFDETEMAVATSQSITETDCRNFLQSLLEMSIVVSTDSKYELARDTKEWFDESSDGSSLVRGEAPP